MNRLLFLSTFLSVFLLAHPKTFGQLGLPGNTLTLDKIEVTDIFSAGSNQVNDGIINKSSISPSLTAPSLTTTVNRTVSNIWRLELDANQDENQISVSYGLNSDQGTTNSLSKGGISEQIKVSITPINPTIDPNSAKRILQGGAIFNLDFSDIKIPGVYSGTLTITFTGI
ncbi:hypothetical protein NIES2109_19550 [Nostoc sp. HK-01]|uniref:Uncharacterized protein n=1 Tax=Nostoc cycadae WK-1 TaxID=1861711 RepID=A0A2H6LQ09_9NOSO|nr:hypothetical protein [Nostoc cycadae]BBD59173.1 hypothetical protein NIES2109_19550 [Nostoc sp. HK-01]GBE95300.1 hypothetical protein NCWK1_5085 [Nostoc cycadae WK-1]